MMNQIGYYDELGSEKKAKKKKHLSGVNYVPYALTYSSHWSSQHPVVINPSLTGRETKSPWRQVICKRLHRVCSTAETNFCLPDPPSPCHFYHWTPMHQNFLNYLFFTFNFVLFSQLYLFTLNLLTQTSLPFNLSLTKA